VKRLRRLKFALAWLAIAALLSHAALLAAPKPAARADGVLGPLVICTADGAKVVPDHGGPDGPAPCNHCPACLIATQYALAAVGGEPVSITFPTPSAPRLILAAVDPLPVHLVRGGTYSRGPPHHAA
jgi:hypothetical protein